tara:strand:+ start:2575 stop:3471 length:897 start_codon:yes stop_codon:yes gene_type:complete
MIESNRKGIILAGGKGTRLNPITKAVSKQLMPIYDKPMIYYPLSTLMLIGIKNILIITTPDDQESFKSLLGDGNSWGINIKYEIQKKPEGLAQAFIIGKNFIDKSPVALILGDNIFYGEEMIHKIRKSNLDYDKSTIFGYAVKDPSRYGVVEFNEKKEILSLEEKPYKPKSRFVITGLYFYENNVIEKVKNLQPSIRGELEITDLNKEYLKERKLNLELFSRGTAWLDTGTFDSLYEACGFIQTLEKRQGFKVGCPEEVAWRNGWISDKELKIQSLNYKNSGYGDYLSDLLKLKNKFN